MEHLYKVFIAFFAMSAVESLYCPPRPWPCRCDQRRKIVYCNERKLRQVPNRIPSDTKVLLLQGNFLENQQSLETNLAALTKLERLDMHDNNLTSFPSRLPKSLIYLSLSMNKIKYIGKNALNNLRNLKELHLDSNNITNRGIAQNAFQPVESLEDLTISSNKLTSLPESLPRSLMIARFERNKINVVSTHSLDSLQNLLVLDLSYNLITGHIQNFDRLVSLRTLDLSHNYLVEVPAHLPDDLTELLLASNYLQYIYATSDNDHGDLQNLPKLMKLDLSSNNLKSVEEGAFNGLPSSLSMELHYNPWVCDCHLVYLKRWLMSAASLLTSSEGSIQCATPVVFSRVTLSAIDPEVLRCMTSSYNIKIGNVQSESITMEYDVFDANEPPYVTFSAIYGAINCNDCKVQSEGYSPVHYITDLWMDNYTIIPLLPFDITVLTDLTPNTRYALCVVASYQSPDEITIKQCEVVRTSSNANLITTVNSNKFNPGIPKWVLIVGAITVGLFIAVIVLSVVWYRQRKHSSLQSYIRARTANPAVTVDRYFAGKGISMVDAIPEFDVTLMVRKDLAHQNDGGHSDIPNESVSTSYTETMTT